MASPSNRLKYGPNGDLSLHITVLLVDLNLPRETTTTIGNENIFYELQPKTKTKTNIYSFLLSFEQHYS